MGQNVTINQYYLTTIQPVFDGYNFFASCNVYGDSIEYSGTRVCDRFHSLSKYVEHRELDLEFFL